MKIVKSIIEFICDATIYGIFNGRRRRLKRAEKDVLIQLNDLKEISGRVFHENKNNAREGDRVCLRLWLLASR